MAKKRRKPAVYSNAHLVDRLIECAVAYGDGEDMEPTVSAGAAALALMDKYVLQLAQYMETEALDIPIELPPQPPQLLTTVWERFAAAANDDRYAGRYRATMRRAKRRMSELGMRAAIMLEQLGEDY